MALAAGTIWEVQNGGSDTANGGGFNPANTNMDNTLQATGGNTSSPVVSTSGGVYSFSARDVGHWLFVKSGTNWTPGWYQIASVSAGAATLTAGVGTAPLYTAPASSGMNTAAGCATVATPSGGTWSIDYSQTGSAGVSFTDLVAATTTTFTSSANPVGKNFVGNVVSITSGTGWNVARWEVSSVTGTTGTAANFSTGSTIATAASTGGTGGLGGAWATPGRFTGVAAKGNVAFVKYNASPYSMTTATAGAAGPVSVTGTTLDSDVATLMVGYDTTRTVLNTDANRPTYQASGAISSFSMFGNDNAKGFWFRNLIADGNSKATATGFTGAQYRRCRAVNCVTGFSTGNSEDCYATACTSRGFSLGTQELCVAVANTGATGFYQPVSNTLCVSRKNSVGIEVSGAIDGVVRGSIADNNTSHGFVANASFARYLVVSNCIASRNGGRGYLNSGTFNFGGILWTGNASFQNTSTNSLGTSYQEQSAVALTTTPYVGPFDATSVAWTASTKTLTKTGAFTDAFVGATVYVTAGTGVTPGRYTVATVVSANAVTLTTSIAGADTSDVTIEPVFELNNEAGGGAVLRAVTYALPRA